MRVSPASSAHKLLGYKHHETASAVLFEIVSIDDAPLEEPAKEWFPISQISKALYQSVNNTDEEALDMIEVPAWLLQKKGYI